MTIKIVVATHKKYDMPQNELYLPLQVGAANNENLQISRDDEGENISFKNPQYCELTGLFFAWKNVSAEALGLVHYRRYFAGKLPFAVNGKIKKILDEPTAQKLLGSCDLIFPKKRRYYIETLYSHYAHTMFVQPLDITGEIIKEKYPQYFAQFQRLKKRRSAHMFNMFVAKREFADGYCQWLFDILSELEKRVTEQYDDFHSRFYGRISELLLDVYVYTNKLKYKEVKVVGTEKSNFFKKLKGFLRAKFKKEKYTASF